MNDLKHETRHKTNKMPGLYLFVSPIDQDVKLPQTDSGFPHITVAYAKSEEMETLVDYAQMYYEIEMEVVGSTVTLDSSESSVFLKNGKPRSDLLLNLSDEDAKSIEQMRQGLDPNKFVMRKPHVTFSTNYQDGDFVPNLPLKVRIIGVGIYSS